MGNYRTENYSKKDNQKLIGWAQLQVLQRTELVNLRVDQQNLPNLNKKEKNL